MKRMKRRWKKDLERVQIISYYSIYVKPHMSVDILFIENGYFFLDNINEDELKRIEDAKKEQVWANYPSFPLDCVYDHFFLLDCRNQKKVQRTAQEDTGGARPQK